MRTGEAPTFNAARDHMQFRSSAGVREGGLEPPRPFGHRILSPARLPVPALSRCKRAAQSNSSASGSWHGLGRR